jgi:cystathionine beta-lyase/cystathionine gamma-synthase
MSSDPLPSETALAFETLAVHAGYEPDPVHGAVMPAIVLSTTFAQPEPGRARTFEYGRSGNPTRAALEACLAALEGGKRGFAFSSGCAAATTLLHTLSPGDHVVAGDDVYGGTYRLFERVMKPLGISASFVDLRSPEALEGALRKETRLVWLESPTNPMLRLFDIARVSEIARARRLPVVVDNTFASPALQRPLELGATVVLHSTTKYMNGHSDHVGPRARGAHSVSTERDGRRPEPDGLLSYAARHPDALRPHGATRGDGARARGAAQS